MLALLKIQVKSLALVSFNALINVSETPHTLKSLRLQFGYRQGLSADTFCALAMTLFMA